MSNFIEAIGGVKGINRADERTLTVTITLEEYRDLVVENTMLEMELIDLKNQHEELKAAFDELMGDE